MSVIITSYNEAEYLPEAIESCLSQSFCDFEIIIGDDGSNDNSPELIKQYCEKYPGKIRTFTMERPKDKKCIIPTLRVSDVIKRGLETARGKYAVILNGDDYFCDDEKFSDAVKFLEANPKYNAYVSAFKWLYQDGSEKFTYPPDYFCPTNLFWAAHYIHFSCFVFRTSIFEQGYFLERFYADNGTVFALACAGKWKFSDKVTFTYRQRDGSIVYTVPKMEYQVLHIAFLQDLLCSGRMKWETYCKFYGAFRFVYEHRQELDPDKYEKYFVNCEKYGNNVLLALSKCDNDPESRRYISRVMMMCKIASRYFRYTGKFYRIPRKLRKIFRKLLPRS